MFGSFSDIFGVKKQEGGTETESKPVDVQSREQTPIPFGQQETDDPSQPLKPKKLSFAFGGEKSSFGSQGKSLSISTHSLAFFFNFPPTQTLSYNTFQWTQTRTRTRKNSLNRYFERARTRLGGNLVISL